MDPVNHFIVSTPELVEAFSEALRGRYPSGIHCYDLNVNSAASFIASDLSPLLERVLLELLKPNSNENH